jgi:large subunit ribosomal protein L18
MAHTNPRRQKRQQRHARIRKKVMGSAERPRLAVFRSAKHIYAQAIDDLAGRTLAAASTIDKELKADLKTYSGNKESAKSVGKAIAERLVKLGIQQVVFDRGGNRYHGRVRALAESAREAGLQF